MRRKRFEAQIIAREIAEILSAPSDDRPAPDQPYPVQPHRIAPSARPASVPPSQLLQTMGVTID